MKVNSSLIVPLVVLAVILPVQQASAFGMWNNPWALRRRLIDSVFNDPFFMDPFAVFESPFFDATFPDREAPDAVCQPGDGACTTTSNSNSNSDSVAGGNIPIGGAVSDDQGAASTSDASLSSANTATNNVPAASASASASAGGGGAPAVVPSRSEEWFGSLLRAPALDIVPREKEFVVTLDVPGVRKEDLNVEILHNDDGSNTLRVSGERKEDTEEGSAEKGNYRKSHRFGKFSRSVRLPANIQLEGLKASHDHGVLKIVVPKTEQKPKSTAVQIM